MAREKLRSGLKRAAWLSLVVLFVVTSLGVGVVAFWQATHPPKDNTGQQTQQTASGDCGTTSENQTESNIEKLPAPEVYKPAGKVTQLQATDLQQGSGPQAKPGDCLVMKYYGSLADSGQVFDQNFDKDTGFKFKLGASQVIPGWDEGLIGMQAGGMRRLVVPANLAYGSTGSPPVIPPNADLVFIVKLEKIE